MKSVLLGISGSIAAYKAADIANELVKSGCEVDVVMTKAACEFITPLTMQTITKRKTNTDMFDEIVPSEVRHISLAQKTEVFLVAPASADIIAKFAYGIADDFLSTIALALPRDTPKIIAPAMNTAMWENVIVQENISRLKRAGFSIIEPREARLACGDVGKGALADVSLIVNAAKAALGTDAAADADAGSAGKTEK